MNAQMMIRIIMNDKKTRIDKLQRCSKSEHEISKSRNSMIKF
jgi:hypothetical protein